MKLKLEITDINLMPEQKGFIITKLAEIEEVLKNKNTESRADRIEKIFNKYRYSPEKIIPKKESNLPLHQEYENETLPQRGLHNEWSNGKKFQAKKEPLSREQSLSREKQKVEPSSIFQQVQAECNLLEIALEEMKDFQKHHYRLYGNEKARDLERFLNQVCSFQMLVKQQLRPLCQKKHNNKTQLSYH